MIDLLMNAAIPHNRNQDHPENYEASLLYGFFKPPVTADYTFVQNCDDNCGLWINETHPYVSETDNPEWIATNALITSAGWSPEFDFDYRPQMESPTISLEANKYYYINMAHT